jgi:hypothetical protein
LPESIEDFRKTVESSKEHLDIVHQASSILSTYQNVWKPKWREARTHEEKQSLLCDLAMLRAKLRIVDEVEVLLFPDYGKMFSEWKAKRRKEPSGLEMIYDF